MEKKGELIWEAPAGETVVGIAACGDSIVIATSARVYRMWHLDKEPVGHWKTEIDPTTGKVIIVEREELRGV